MANGSYIQVDVQCPFYRTDLPGERKLVCEEITENETSTTRMFKTKAKMYEFMREYCCKNYKYCEYFRMMMEFKY